MLPLLLMSPVLKAVLVIGGMALLLGLIIVLIFKLFHVPSDHREDDILEILPGVNCGGCGYSGCQGYAKALASGSDENIGKCSPGGQEVVEMLAAYLGKEPTVFIPKMAQVKCQGSCFHERVRYEYKGSDSCASAHGLFAGPGACVFSCIGLGDCERACPYGAIKVIDDLARVNPDKCIACGRCVAACPKNLISIEPMYTDLHLVRCMNPLPGKDVRQACDIGCIGCQLCVKKCPVDAISMVDHRAVIDQDLCIHCGACARVCPSKSITKGLISPEDIARQEREAQLKKEEKELELDETA